MRRIQAPLLALTLAIATGCPDNTATYTGAEVTFADAATPPDLGAAHADAPTESAPRDSIEADAFGSAELPADFIDLALVTTSTADAGDPPFQTVTKVSRSRALYLRLQSEPPVMTTMTPPEALAFAHLINRAGALDAIFSADPCGPHIADYSEQLTAERSGGHVDKEITGCHQQPFEDLRSFLSALRDAHVDQTSGACLAPNIWRYTSPGCGAEAHPTCGSPGGDACLQIRCGCDGQDISGCDFTTAPFAHVGPCQRDGGAGQ